MRNLIAGLTSMLIACQGGGETTGHRTSSILAGSAIIATGFDSVCGLYVELPLDEDNLPQDPIWCAGTHVAPGILLTAASCVEENLTANMVAMIEARCAGDGSETHAVAEVVLHRYYARETGSQNDLALVRLTTTPARPIAQLNESALTADNLGPTDPAECTDLSVSGCAALIGYGETANAMQDFGSRLGVLMPVRDVEARHLLIGPDDSGCRGDTGAPLFMDLGAGPVLVGVSSANKNTCTASVVRTRVDAFLDQFIHPYLDRFGATCGLDATCETSCPRSPDADCDPCAWNDDCEEACPTRDWDCPLGSFVGDACADSGDCEEDGRCVAAHDDGAFTYCSRPCDAAVADACPAGMVCADDGDGGTECVFDPAAPSPGSQGADCITELDCRSGICEETYCVIECDPAAAEPCPPNLTDPEVPYTCEPSSVEPGTNVCIGQVFSGGGGFCNAGGRGGGWIGWLVLAVLLAGRRASRRAPGRARPDRR